MKHRTPLILLILCIVVPFWADGCGTAPTAATEPTSQSETPPVDNNQSTDDTTQTEDPGTDTTDTPPDPEETTPPGPLTLTSSAMENAGPFPVRHACKWYYEFAGAENVSPHLAWTGGPTETQSYAIIFKDLTFNGFLHSIIWDIPASTSSLEENLPRDANLQTPAGAKQCKGYAGEVGYEGPCPGWSEHTYEFEIFALPSATLEGVSINSSMDSLQTAIENASLESATLSALFTPPPEP